MDGIEKLIEEGEKQLQEEGAKREEALRIKAEEAESRRRDRYEALRSILPLEVQPYFDYGEFQDAGNLHSYWIYLNIPECTDVFIELNPHAQTIEGIKVALPDEGYRREPHRVEDLRTALALARRYYRQEEEMAAQMAALKETEEPKVYEKPKAYDVPHNYLLEAIIASSNGDMAAAEAFALIGILEVLKNGVALSELGEVESSGRIWGSDGS